MKTNIARTIMILTGVVLLSACSAEKVVDRSVDSALFVGRTAVKGTVGAGKLVVRGTGAAINAATSAD